MDIVVVETLPSAKQTVIICRRRRDPFWAGLIDTRGKRDIKESDIVRKEETKFFLSFLFLLSFHSLARKKGQPASDRV